MKIRNALLTVPVALLAATLSLALGVELAGAEELERSGIASSSIRSTVRSSTKGGALDRLSRAHPTKVGSTRFSTRCRVPEE